MGSQNGRGDARGWNTGRIDTEPPIDRRSPPLLPRPTRRSRLRRSSGLQLTIRILLSLAMLWVLIWQLPDVKFDDLGPDWTSSSPLWLTAAGLTKVAAFAWSAQRWRTVLTAMGVRTRFRDILNHFMAGQFVSNVLPSAIGGDVMRVTRLGREIGSNPVAFASVTIERMTGWLVLPVISLTAFVVEPDLRGLGRATHLAVTIDIATLVGLVVVLLVAANRRFAHTRRGDEGWRRYLVAIHLGVDALRRTPRSAIQLILVGFAFQILQTAAVWMAARGIGADGVTLWAAMAFFPSAAIAQNLPIGLGGLGVREGLFVIFFRPLGTPEALAITLGLTIHLLTVISSAFGLPAFLVGGRTKHGDADSEAPPPDPAPRHRRKPSQDSHNDDAARAVLET